MSKQGDERVFIPLARVLREVAEDDGVVRLVDGDPNGSGVIRIECVC